MRACGGRENAPNLTAIVKPRVGILRFNGFSTFDDTRPVPDAFRKILGVRFYISDLEIAPNLTAIVKPRVGILRFNGFSTFDDTRPVPDAFRKILGVRFYISDLEGLIELVAGGGLIVVPSAPVMVRLADDAAHRKAMEGADFAVTDSAFMVLLWLVLTGERVRRITGLRLLRGLFGRGGFRGRGETGSGLNLLGYYPLYYPLLGVLPSFAISLPV